MPLPQNGISFAAAPGIQQPGHLRQIDGGSFWPDTDLDQMRLSCRIDNTVTPERLFQAALEAVAETRRQLSALTRRHSSLNDVQTAGQTDPAERYRAAVYAYTKALLLEQYADYDAAGKAGTLAEAKTAQARAERRNGHYAVADLLSRYRNDCELV